jgi:hypothetical protein
MIKVHAAVDDAQALAQLARQVDRLERHSAEQRAGIDRVAADVAAHGRALRTLSEVLRRPGPQPGPGAGAVAPEAPPEWMTVTDPQLAVAWLSQVAGWVETVWTYYGPLPPCWAWHPVVVAELLACRSAWIAATRPGAPAEGLAGWHDRWRPGAERRVADAVRTCVRADGRHADSAARYLVDASCLDEVALWWATTHGAAPAPGLTLDTQR